MVDLPDPVTSRRPQPVGILSELAHATNVPVVLQGRIGSIQIKCTNLGDLWAIYVLRTEDFDITARVFPRTYQATWGALSATGATVHTTGVAWSRAGDISLVVDTIHTIE